MGYDAVLFNSSALTGITAGSALYKHSKLQNMLAAESRACWVGTTTAGTNVNSELCTALKHCVKTLQHFVYADGLDADPGGLAV